MSDDSTIDLKKRARRRLVGAAALALLAVIVLPVVMDSEPKPSGQEIQIRIPNRDSDSLTAPVIPGNVLPSPLPKNEVPIAPVSNLTESAAKQVVSASAAAPAMVAKPKADVAAAKSEPVAKNEIARAEAMLEGRGSGTWIVQLGSYQNAANVKQLIAKIKALGLSSYTEKFDSAQGQRTRVRAGPFKSQEEADKARVRIKKIGVDGSVVQK